MEVRELPTEGTEWAEGLQQGAGRPQSVGGDGQPQAEPISYRSPRAPVWPMVPVGPTPA